MLSNALAPHRRELFRAIRDHKYERTESGILVPGLGSIAGFFETTINGRDPQVDPNIIPTEGLNLILDTIADSGEAGKDWYVALFSTNTVPIATLTGATWRAAQTEFTGYDEADRVAFVKDAAAGGILSNNSNRAEFTINAAATVYGGALVEAQAKNADTGKLLACARFGAGRAVQSGDTLQVKYTLTLTSGA